MKKILLGLLVVASLVNASESDCLFWLNLTTKDLKEMTMYKKEGMVTDLKSSYRSYKRHYIKTIVSCEGTSIDKNLGLVKKVKGQHILIKRGMGE